MINRLCTSKTSDVLSLVWQLKCEFVEPFVQKPKVRNRNGLVDYCDHFLYSIVMTWMFDPQVIL